MITSVQGAALVGKKWIIIVMVQIAIVLWFTHLTKWQCNEDTKTNDIIQARNFLSSQLNQMSKSIGQMQCQASRGKTNEKGGWCRQMSYENSGQHKTDQTLIPKLAAFLANKAVASFGDGPGAYKREILKLGTVKSYDAFDGAPYCEETSSGRVKFMDLTIPQYGIPIYDWIISLEVAEHIPGKFEAIYLDNIFRHAKEGIILSWAIPGQGGLSHINNKPLQYVINIMNKNGFRRDRQISEKLQNSSWLPWLRQNLNVYVRKTSHVSYKDMISFA